MTTKAKMTTKNINNFNDNLPEWLEYQDYEKEFVKHFGKRPVLKNLKKYYELFDNLYKNVLQIQNLITNQKIKLLL
jgi:hypothetical protein